MNNNKMTIYVLYTLHMGHANLLRIVSILSDVSNGAKVYRFSLDALVESRIQDRQRKIFFSRNIWEKSF